MKIILVRHGQTKWNKDEVFRGRADIPLDATGTAEAEATASALARVEMAAVYSSPLARAHETARIIARPHSLLVRAVDGLADIDCGAWEGLSVEEARSKYPQVFEAWQSAPHTVTFPEGESLDDVAARATSALQEIQASHAENETVVIVSHRVVNKLLLLWVLGLDSSAFWKIRQDTCCINVISHGPAGFVLHALNDRCHLARCRPFPDAQRDF